MSMQPFTSCQNSNNIVLVPSVIENNINDTAASICLPACEQGTTDYVLPAFHESNIVINYGNVHFNGCVNGPNYVYPYNTVAINADYKVTHAPCSKYSSSNNLVDLTRINYPTTFTTPSCSSNKNSIVYSNEIFPYNNTQNTVIYDKQIYPDPSNIGYEIVAPSITSYQLHNNFIVTPESQNLSFDIMSQPRIMRNYGEYDDLRNVIEERQINIRESKPLKVDKGDTDPNDLKHLLRSRKKNTGSSFGPEKNEPSHSIHRELEFRDTFKPKRRTNTFDKDSKIPDNVSRTSKNPYKLEQKYQQTSSQLNPGLIERKTFSKAQKSNLSPGALKRYLAYQRFLRSCYKSPSPSLKRMHNLKKDIVPTNKNHLHLDEKETTILKRKENIKENTKKPINVECTNTKEKQKDNATNKVDRKRKDKVTSSKDKSESKVAAKAATHIIQNNTEEVNTKWTTYSEKKKKKLELKQRLLNFVDRKKNKAESESTLNKLVDKNKKRLTKSSEVAETPSSSDLPNKRNDNIDLRTVLTRKSESKYIKAKTSKHEKVTITVKQDKHAKKQPTKVTHTASKTKSKKTKRIKLVINIVCPNSADSDDTEQSVNEPSTSPHQDLSFLDDFNVDEIVDSLDVSSSQNSRREKDITSTEDLDNSDVNTNECITKLIKAVKNPIEDDKGPPLHDVIKKDELAKTLIANANSCIEEHQPKNCHNMNNKLNAANNKMKIEPMEYCGNVYEVIDIITSPEEDIDVDFQSHHENIEVVTTSGIKVEDKIEKIFQVCHNIQKEDIGVKTKDIIKQGTISNIVKSDVKAQETENIRTNEQVSMKHKQQYITDIENTNTTAKDAVPPAIKDLGNRYVITDTKAQDTKNAESLNPKDKTRKRKINQTCEDTDAHNDKAKCIKVVSNDTSQSESFKVHETEITLIDIPKEKHDKTPDINCFDENMNKPTDKLTKAASSPDIVQSKNSKNNIGRNDTKLDGIKVANKSDKKQSSLATVISNEESTSEKVSKPSKDISDENIKIKPTNSNTNKTENASKSGQNHTDWKENSVSNVEQNNNEAVATPAAHKIVKDSKIMKLDQTKQEENITPALRNPYIKGIEKRMSKYLNLKLTITALIHTGYFSNIYKCNDLAGDNYALKVVKSQYRSTSIYKDRILSYLQKTTVEDNYYIIKVIESFNALGNWCYLTDYYPKTLAEALVETGKCFHIDLVQTLARQLVAAVTLLVNNQIVHSDIKPSHILLNSTNDKLKLCSFDRAGYSYNIRIIPSSGTASYRAPEMILGYNADHSIDVWATALVMYEMATGIQLFPGRYNNDILYKQLCTLGPLDYDMLQECSLRNMHFLGTKFMRQLSNQKWVFVQFCGTNNKLRHKLFASYNREWRPSRTQWQVTKDLDKIEMLFKLLEQMLVMDPRHRLPITFVGANEFIYDMSDSDIR